MFSSDSAAEILDKAWTFSAPEYETKVYGHFCNVWSPDARHTNSPSRCPRCSWASSQVSPTQSYSDFRGLGPRDRKAQRRFLGTLDSRKCCRKMNTKYGNERIITNHMLWWKKKASYLPDDRPWKIEEERPESMYSLIRKLSHPPWCHITNAKRPLCKLYLMK